MDEANLVEFLLENLELLLRNSSYSIPADISPVLISLHEDLKFIKSFLKRIKEGPFDQKKLYSSLLGEIRDVISNLLVVTDSCVINGHFQSSPKLASYSFQFSLFKKQILAFHNDASSSSTATKEVGEVSGDEVMLSRIKSSSQLVVEEKMVGFDDEATALLDRLTGGQKQLEVVSLVGMAGIGKTALAKRLYNDPRVAYHFHVRGWTCGPKPIDVKIALLDILSCMITNKDSLHKMSCEEMGEKLYKFLKRKRDLIAIGEMWDFFTWDVLMKRYFPDDSTGSKILMTSRIKQVLSLVNPSSSPHELRFLSRNESWNLFESKVFINETCPQEMMEIGKDIVEKCKGVPLAIVVVAGLAKKDRRRDWWMHLAKNTSSCIHGDENGEFMDILRLSYDHLPNCLRSCFLYIGSFPPAYEIPVKKLIWSWIAEGFIEQNGEKTLEDVAESYLADLVDRSLVLVSKRRFNGGIKTCHIHDLFRDLCVKKSKDNMLLQPICGYEQILHVSHLPNYWNYSNEIMSSLCV